MREATLLTRGNISRNGAYLDWDTQPAIFKHYPEFCYRIPLSNVPRLSWLSALRCITDVHTIGLKPYYRLNVPSAGNLHPVEVYVQIRNMSGMLSGIYHVDILHQALVLIEEIGSSGIEPYLGIEHRMSGFIVMFSIIPFRSSWKYGLRAWRYCYLDLGHQIAVLSALMMENELNATKLSVIDAEKLNTIMGFTEEEKLGAVFVLGEETTKRVKPLISPLLKVLPTDYTRTDSVLLQSMIDEPIFTDIPSIHRSFWSETINCSRRSARTFYPYALNDDLLKSFFELSYDQSIEVVYVILQAQTMHCGVYRNQECIEEGYFASETVALLLDQRFIHNAGMVALIFSEHFDSKSHIKAGMFAHQLYMLSESLALQCSGIGAFYDHEALRWSENKLIYAVAIGGKEDE